MRFLRLLMMLSVVVSAGTILVIVFRLPFLAVLVGGLLSMRKKSEPLTAHGTARFADSDDLEKAGMLGDTGLAVGRVLVKRPRVRAAVRALFDRRVPAKVAVVGFIAAIRKGCPATAVVRLSKAIHVLTVAPAGAGKTTRLVAPFLLEHRGSCVVLDPKGELAKLTADARRAMGHKVAILDPGRMVAAEPDRLNVLESVDWDSPNAPDQLRSIANEIVVRTGSEKDPHFNERAEDVLYAMMAYLSTVEPALRHLQSVRDLITNEALRDEAIEQMMKSDKWGRVLKRAGQSIAGLLSEEKASVYSTALRHTNFLDSVTVSESTSRSTFDPAELKTGDMTVYLCLPSDQLRSKAGLMRLWVGTMLRACQKTLGEERLVTFVLDESAVLRRLDVLEDALTLHRGFGVRVHLFVQSLAQLKLCWRDAADALIIANTSLVAFGIRDFETAEVVSKMAGQRTIIVADENTNNGGSSSTNRNDAGGSYGRSWGGGKGYHQLGRPLARPEELLTLDQHTAISFTAGVPPIVSQLVPYYAHPAAPTRWQRFKAKAKPWGLTVGLFLLTSMAGAWIWAFLTPVRR